MRHLLTSKRQEPNVNTFYDKVIIETSCAVHVNVSFEIVRDLTLAITALVNGTVNLLHVMIVVYDDSKISGNPSIKYISQLCSKYGILLLYRRNLL